MYMNRDDMSYRYFPRQLPPYMQNQHPFYPVPINTMMPSQVGPMITQGISPMVNLGYHDYLQRPPTEQFPIQALFDNPLYPVYNFENIDPFAMNKQFLQHLPPLEQQPKVETNGIMKYFKTQDGTVDLNKMFTAAGQLMGTLNQLQAFIKGFKFMFKS